MCYFCFIVLLSTEIEILWNRVEMAPKRLSPSVEVCCFRLNFNISKLFIKQIMVHFEKGFSEKPYLILVYSVAKV